MPKELIYSVSILLIMLIEPVSWYLLCCKMQYPKILKQPLNVLSFISLIFIIFITNLLSQLSQNHSTISYLLGCISFFIYYMYATKLFHMNHKVAICFLTILNISCKLLEYIYTFTLMIVLRIVSLDYSLQPNLFRVASFLVLYASIGFILFRMSKIGMSIVLMFKEKRVYRTFSLLLFMDLATFLAFSFLTQNRAYEIYNYGTFVTIICETILSVYAVFIVYTGTKKEHEIAKTLDCATSKIEMLQQNKLCSDNAKKVVHDSNNHFCTIGYLLENQLYEKAFQYIKELVPELESARVGESDKNVLVTILFRKQQEAKRYNVKFDFLVCVKDVTLPIMDVSTIIFNMSDNAIEYCQANQLGNYGVMYRIYIQDCSLIFECYNRIVHKPNIDVYGSFITSKSDKENHGFGMRIMKECASKYNGVIEPQYNDNLFVITAKFSSDYAIRYDSSNADLIEEESLFQESKSNA